MGLNHNVTLVGVNFQTVMPSLKEQGSVLITGVD